MARVFYLCYFRYINARPKYIAMKFRILLFIPGFFLIQGISFSQDQSYVPETDTLVIRKLDQWQDLKFGLLMHWGTYSQWGVVESWSICAEDEDWCHRKTDNYEEYKKEYEKLQTTFNPSRFDPSQWAAAARDAGMKYVIFTTKHHDGFCMFDTKYTNYKITDTACPFSRNVRANITREIFNAFRAEGFWVGPYFSKPDWHCEYYWWPNFATPDRNVNYDIKRYPDRWENYVTFTHNQIDELMSEYGPVDILWLDGGWVQPLSAEEITKEFNSPGYKFMHIQSQDIRMDEIVVKAREKQPGLIVVDRAVPGRNQDYLTPENQVPNNALPYPWESCIISGGSWSWIPSATYMTPRQVIQLLVDIVAKGGNLLLNIAPGPDGSWDEGAYKMLAGVGVWMKVNGEAIYGTRPVKPYKEGKVCLTRKKDGTVYAIYLAGENETRPPSKIWLSTVQPEKDAIVSFVGSNERLKWEAVGSGFEATIPENIRQLPPCDHAWVLKISKIRE
jgi:alpha-L-fucosidase